MAGVFPPAPLDLPLRFSRCSPEAGFDLRVPVVPTAQASSQVPSPAFEELTRSFRPLRLLQVWEPSRVAAQDLSFPVAGSHCFFFICRFTSLPNVLHFLHP